MSFPTSRMVRENPRVIGENAAEHGAALDLALKNHGKPPFLAPSFRGFPSGA